MSQTNNRFAALDTSQQNRDSGKKKRRQSNEDVDQPLLDSKYRYTPPVQWLWWSNFWFFAL